MLKIEEFCWFTVQYDACWYECIISMT